MCAPSRTSARAAVAHPARPRCATTQILAQPIVATPSPAAAAWPTAGPAMTAAFAPSAMSARPAVVSPENQSVATTPIPAPTTAAMALLAANTLQTLRLAAITTPARPVTVAKGANAPADNTSTAMMAMSAPMTRVHPQLAVRTTTIKRNAATAASAPVATAAAAAFASPAPRSRATTAILALQIVAML